MCDNNSKMHSESQSNQLECLHWRDQILFCSSVHYIALMPTDSLDISPELFLVEAAYIELKVSNVGVYTYKL